MSTLTNTPGTRINVGDWATEAKAIGCELSSLPRPIRGIVGQLRLAFNQRQLLDHIEHEVDAMARRRGAYVRVHSDTGPSYDVLPADIRKDYLQQLVRRIGFLTSLRKTAQKILRSENGQKRVYPEPGLHLDERVPPEGTLVVRGSTRLNRVESIFETSNVGTLSAVGHWIIDNSPCPIVEDIGLEENERPIKVLSWHCGLAGLLAIILDLLKPRDRKFLLVEVDVFGDVRDRHESTWWSGAHGTDSIDNEKSGPVVARRHDLSDVQFDFVLLEMPPPGEGQGQNLRNTWKSQEERTLRDPGRYSPKTWRKELRAYIQKLPELLEGHGQALLLLPLGVREARGYRDHTQLLIGVESWLQGADLEIIRDVMVDEKNPVPQPFVGNSRPKRRLLIVRRRAA